MHSLTSIHPYSHSIEQRSDTSPRDPEHSQGGAGWRSKISSSEEHTPLRRELHQGQADVAPARAGAELDMLARISWLANTAESVHHALHEALGCICGHTGYAVGHAYLGGAGDWRQLAPTTLWWGANDAAIAAFCTASEVHPLTGGRGFPARALEIRFPVQSSDVRAESDYNRRAEADAAGLCGGLVIPILVAGQVRAALELYAYERRALSEETLQLLSTCGVILGRAVERHLYGEQLLAERVARQDAELMASEMVCVVRDLQRCNQELDQFVYVASHDLKAPLRGIACLAGWLGEDLGDQLSDESRRHLDLLKGRAQRMESLIDGLLAYSRAGRSDQQYELVDTRGLLHETLELLDRPSDVTIAIASDMPVLVTYRLPLQQVFHNLAGNALKHGRTKKLHIEIGSRDAGEWHEFWVKDNGPGIHPRYQDKVWGLFQTLQARDKVEGTGIGLALVKKIVEHQGGAVRLVSQPRRGATFLFRWPKVPR